MKIGPCAARWAVGLTLGALLCLITSSRAQSTDGECAALGAVNEFTVRSSSDAATLDVLVYSCQGEVFEVTWEGRVGLLSPIAIHNGTSLSITGVVGSSSSAQLGGGGSHAVIEAVEGSSTRYPSFYVLSESTLTLNNLVLENNPYDPADYGGSIYAYTNATESPVSPATVNVNGCTFQNNTASLGGGAIFCEGCDLHIADTTFVGFDGASSYLLQGGAICANYSEVFIEGNTTFADINAHQGGVINTDSSTLRIEDSVNFSGNEASWDGGAIFANNSEVYIDGNITFSGNEASLGGAIFVSSSEIYIDGDTAFSGNSAIQAGAIRSEYSILHIDGGVSFANNTASVIGGAMRSDYSELYIDGDVTFHNNSADDGGALYSSEDKAIIAGNVNFSWNGAESSGGAIAVFRPLNLSVSGAAFVSNRVENSFGSSSFFVEPTGGGAIWLDSGGNEEAGCVPSWNQECDGPLLANLTFDNNSAASNGRAVFVSTPFDSVFIQGTTFHKNFAESSGGAVFHHTGYLTVTDANFTSNLAAVDGLAVASLGYIDIDDRSSLFANNSFYCPLGQFSSTKDGSEIIDYKHVFVCSRCSRIGNNDLQEDEPACEDLPRGVKALSSGTTVSSFNLERGFFRISAESQSVLECYNEDACLGGGTVGEYCAPGYQGPSCAVCSDTYAPGLGFSCHKCEGPSGESAKAVGGIVFVVVVVIVALILMDFAGFIGDDGVEDADEAKPRTCKRGINWVSSVIAKSVPLTAFKTVIVVWQIITQFAAIAADTYPDVYDEFISKLTFINVNIGFFVSSSCVVRTNFHHRLLFATLTPLGVLLVLRVTYHVAKKRNDGCQRALLAVKHKHLSAALFIAFFIYSAVSFTIFQTFVCDTLDDGVRYLRADYSLTCSGAQHKHYVVFSGLMVLLYPLGIPLICMWWVNEHQDELRRVDRDTIVALKPFQSIWAAYKPRRYFFEIVEFGRRLTLTVAAVFVSPGSSAQIAIVLLLAVVFLFVSESLSPFSRSSDMGLYRWGNGIVLGSMYVALLLKFDVSEEESGPLSAFAGVLVAANVFMVITVIVQSYFMVKEWRKADKSIEAPDPVASSGISGSTSCRRNEVGKCSPAAADGSAEPGKEW